MESVALVRQIIVQILLNFFQIKIHEALLFLLLFFKKQNQQFFINGM